MTKAKFRKIYGKGGKLEAVTLVCGPTICPIDGAWMTSPKGDDNWYCSCGRVQDLYGNEILDAE